MQLVFLIIIIAGGAIVGFALLAFLYFLMRTSKPRRRQYGTLEEGSSLKERLVEPTRPPRSSGRALAGAEYVDPKEKKRDPRPAPTDTSTMHAMNFLRAQSNYTLKQALIDIGQRRDKAFFLVTSEEDVTKKNLLLSMVSIPQSVIKGLSLNDDAQRATFAKVLRSIRHPFIQEIEFSSFFSGTGRTLYLFGVVSWQAKGSIRDLLYKARPEDSVDTKYFGGKSGSEKGFQAKRIAKYGAQILEALSFLNANKYPYNHLHCGNLVVENDVCKLADIYNPLCGIKPQIEPDVGGDADRDQVVAFGRVLFEMATGYELGSNELIAIPDRVPAPVRDVLHLIMKTDRVPDVDTLLQHKFFAKAGARPGSAVKDKAIFSSKCRDLLKQARTQTRRLRRKTLEAIFSDEEKREEDREKERERKERREQRALERQEARDRKREEIVERTRSSTISRPSTTTTTAPTSTTTTTTTTTSTAPPPPPPPTASARTGSAAPPPPPPPAAAAPPPGRASLLDSIRNSGGVKKNLKKVQPPR